MKSLKEIKETCKTQNQKQAAQEIRGDTNLYI